jgi:hypothetical protein
MVRAWEVLYEFPTLRRNPDVLGRISDDFSNLPGFEGYLRNNPSKKADWIEFDDFFNTRTDDYWAQFNNPPGVLIQTRTRALKALQEYPDEYVSALESFGLAKADLFTKHGVDYGDEFFTLINDFKASNINGLSDDEIYAVFGYTTNFFYRDLNNWLRTGVNLDKTSEINGILTSALNKLPSWSGTSTAFRGIKIKPPNVQGQIDGILGRYPQGAVVPHGELISVGSTPEASFLYGNNIRIRMEFDLKPGTQAKDISDLADGIFFRGNPPQELLFPSNTSFRVDLVTPPDADGVVTIFFKEQ